MVQSLTLSRSQEEPAAYDRSAATKGVAGLALLRIDSELTDDSGPGGAFVCSLGGTREIRRAGEGLVAPYLDETGSRQCTGREEHQSPWSVL